MLVPDAQAFCLDFHRIPHRGDPEVLDHPDLPMQGKAAPRVLGSFAHEPRSRVLGSAHANLTRADRRGELMRFVALWPTRAGPDPQWRYFDRTLAPSPARSTVNERTIWFVTIRRRGAAILRRLNAAPANAGRRTVIAIPKRRPKRIRSLDETVRVRGDPGPLRPWALAGLGRDEPTLGLSPNFEAGARDLMTRSVGRHGIEDALGLSVTSFHRDCRAREVRLEVDLDVTLTVIAPGCYRWLAARLHGSEEVKPKPLDRRFVETGGVVEIRRDRIIVHFDKRSHHPILREAAWDRDCPQIPWLGNLRVTFEDPGDPGQK